MEKVHKHIIQSQSHDRDNNEFDKKYIGIATTGMKCPFQVQEKIIDNGTGEAKAVGDVFIDFYFLFKKPGYEKVNEHADEADNAEFYHL